MRLKISLFYHNTGKWALIPTLKDSFLYIIILKMLFHSLLEKSVAIEISHLVPYFCMAYLLSFFFFYLEAYLYLPEISLSWAYFSSFFCCHLVSPFNLETHVCEIFLNYFNNGSLAFMMIACFI